MRGLRGVRITLFTAIRADRATRVVALVGAWLAVATLGPSTPAARAALGDQLAKLTASDAVTFDNFGVSVALSGNLALVGANGDDDDGNQSGSAYLFDISDPENPVEYKLTASDAAAYDFFGNSVALSGNLALVGASVKNDLFAGSDSGSAYLFDISDPENPVEYKLTASDAAANDIFGLSVALSGNLALVGAPYDDDGGSTSGSAYLFDVSDPGSPIEYKLTASDAAAYDNFGWSVALSGTLALVGADDDDGGDLSGSAYLFDLSDPENPLEDKLTASDAAASDNFGDPVAISGNLALVGAGGDDDGGSASGSAYLLDVSNPGSPIEYKFTAVDAAADDRFGNSVAISGNTALVGVSRDDDDDGSGSAYLFSTVPEPTAGDFNHDGVCDGDDFLLWQRDPSVGLLSDWEADYGQVAGPPTILQSATSPAVPEPATVLLACVALAAHGVLSHRR